MERKKPQNVLARISGLQVKFLMKYFQTAVALMTTAAILYYIKLHCTILYYTIL